MPSGSAAQLPPSIRASSTLPRQCIGPALHSVAVGEGRGLFSDSHELGPAVLPATGVEGWGGGKGISLTLAPPLRAGLPAPLLSVSAVLCCPGKVQGLLSQVLHLVKGKDISPALVTTGLGCLPAAGGEEQAGRKVSLSHLSTPLYRKQIVGATLPCSYLQG